MFLGILVMITALSISAVAIYYSVAGLVAIFAAAAVPIMIMGGALEIGKLVTAVWLHRYWHEARWFLKTYLSIAVLVLMFITSMGIFGFLSRAHIEQTATATEGLAQIERIDAELIRLGAVIERAEQRITEAEASVGEGNAAIQAQIDLEQQRIDSAYDRIQPAINEQQSIIDNARAADNNRTAPFEAQLTQLTNELDRLANLANDYEARLDNLSASTAAVDRITQQIAELEENIIVTTNRLQSNEPAQIRLGQATIGVTDDGLFGGNTRRALTAWVQAQQERISELESQVVTLRQQAQQDVDRERTRLTSLIDDIRGPQTQTVKQRQAELLATIDEVRATESPVIQRARDEIARIRAGADSQIAASNELIQRLRDSLTVGTDAQVEAVIAEQQQRIIEANNSIDTLTEEKYTLQAEYRKLEAEVGPIKYLAEFIYGETADKDLLEEAVRWVIIIIIFVFDPLAVLLLIASQATFEMHRTKKEASSGERLRLSNEDLTNDTDDVINTPLATEEEKIDDYIDRSSDDGNDRQSESGGTQSASTDRDSTEIQSSGNDSGTDATDDGLPRTEDLGGMLSERVLEEVDPTDIISSYQKKSIKSSEELKKQREQEYELKDSIAEVRASKTLWKQDHPEETLKHYKTLYVQGLIDKLPWEDYTGYKQNEEQNENSLFSKIKRNDE